MTNFAENATPISDDIPLPASGYSRYKDDSTLYKKGFSYKNPLNSALLNGVLHRISSRISELAHCNSAGVPGLQIERFSRYNSAAEVTNPSYFDDRNYILTEDFQKFLSRYTLLKKDDVEDFFLSGRDNTYLSATEAKRCRGLFFGTSLPIRLFATYPVAPTPPTVQSPGTIASKNSINLFKKITNVAQGQIYTLLVIPTLSSIDELCLFEWRNTYWQNYAKQYTYKMNVFFRFENDVMFGGKIISSSTVYHGNGKCTLAIKGSTILFLTGVSDFEQSYNMRDIFGR
ncbi:MAG: hypothetical protein LBJ71_04070 [Holosporaceae bacterium]|jgi:hypothetical protein|nr:hypothetical protein [Holosporaceae bacterium]